MQIFMVSEVQDWAEPLITIAERIKKVMLDKQGGDKRRISSQAVNQNGQNGLDMSLK